MGDATTQKMVNNTFLEIMQQVFNKPDLTLPKEGKKLT